MLEVHEPNQRIRKSRYRNAASVRRAAFRQVEAAPSTAEAGLACTELSKGVLITRRFGAYHKVLTITVPEPAGRQRSRHHLYATIHFYDSCRHCDLEAVKIPIAKRKAGKKKLATPARLRL